MKSGIEWLKATMAVGICALLFPPACLGGAAEQTTILFKADFADAALPGWHKGHIAKPSAVKFTHTEGPDDTAALTIETREPVSAVLSAPLPADRIVGKAVLLEVWRKAENVRTGSRHYYNAKSMLSWKAASAARPEYADTSCSDFSGTFDWEKHAYVMEMPKDLQWARVTIGMQACTGKASWAGLTVSLDPRFPNQRALQRHLARNEREAFAKLDANTLATKRLPGGVIQVLADHKYVPRKYWNEAVRKAVLAPVDRADQKRPPGGRDFCSRLSQAMLARANELEPGLKELTGAALNDRTYEIASLRERVRQLDSPQPQQNKVRLRATAAVSPVSKLIFGNNINTQNMTAPYDFSRRKFREGFLNRVRPMGITLLRYPGGCNADIFNWKDTVGPLKKRGKILNYHNGTGRGLPEFGVDEHLQFCEQEGMVPIITTAFLKDRPERIDTSRHPNVGKRKYLVEYLKTAPERIQLAADWVEYCNGSIDTPMGRLRARNGRPKPYNVKYWEIGNESYGPDPAGSCRAEEYAGAFPAYVAAMKARDPSIKIAMNGCGSRPEWNDTLLAVSGKHADLYQIHIYRGLGAGSTRKLEGRPHRMTVAMRQSDNGPAGLKQLEAQMRQHLGHTLPVVVTEFGMGNVRNRDVMVSVTTSVLVADMLRVFIESPLIIGANKWCLYAGYWFSPVNGPTSGNPDAPFYSRPEQVMHEIYCRCRATKCLAVNNEVSDGAKAVVFKQPEAYGIVIISREAVDWQSVTLDVPGAKAGKATCILVTAGHPLLGNDHDHDLIRKLEFEFDYVPGQAFVVPSNSVMGLIVPGQ